MCPLPHLVLEHQAARARAQVGRPELGRRHRILEGEVGAEPEPRAKGAVEVAVAHARQGAGDGFGAVEGFLHHQVKVAAKGEVLAERVVEPGVPQTPNGLLHECYPIH